MTLLSKKIVVLGDSNVGKTSLIRRFVQYEFSEEYISTIGVNIEKKVVKIENAQITFLIWDLEGQATMEDIPDSYLIGTQGIIFVFDLNRKSTWENLALQFNYLREKYPFVPIKVAGNKSDLVEGRVVDQILPLLDGINIYVCSAKTGNNVELLFNDLAKTFLN